MIFVIFACVPHCMVLEPDCGGSWANQAYPGIKIMKQSCSGNSNKQAFNFADTVEPLARWHSFLHTETLLLALVRK